MIIVMIVMMANDDDDDHEIHSVCVIHAERRYFCLHFAACFFPSTPRPALLATFDQEIMNNMICLRDLASLVDVSFDDGCT